MEVDCSFQQREVWFHYFFPGGVDLCHLSLVQRSLFDTLPWEVSGVFLSTMHPADLLNVSPELAQTLQAEFHTCLPLRVPALISFLDSIDSCECNSEALKVF